MLRRVKRLFRVNAITSFRYGLVLLYVGTLFVVVGYHKPWVDFSRYISVQTGGKEVTKMNVPFLSTCMHSGILEWFW